MEVAFTECVAVTDETSVGEVRRAARLAADRLDLDEERAGTLALLATEASRNTLIHGGGGQVILAGAGTGADSVVRVLALDKGSGISNIAQAMSDGFSTAGTMGGGMGAMKRMAGKFEVFTGQGGTIVMIELGAAPPPSDRLLVAGIALPYPGEKTCGDGWWAHQTSDRTSILIADGLGHGLGAFEAAQEALATFKQRLDLAPGEILSYMHDALRKTRGAVAAIAEIRPKDHRLVYAGVGNTSCVVLAGADSRSLVSHNGTLGITAPRIQEFHATWPPDGVLVMHSDGIQSKWDLTPYRGLLARHPAVIGAALIRDFRRQRDDASVIVIKAA
ncbi:MAG TPA: SpoIIE family protein phosphatase [Terracidiphilus sp.]|jgi:anti-sigma regulatory factor (Ser/Thr protein kinase)